MSYDDDVPNKTIYIADADLPLFQRAQEITGDNLSATIVRALRRLVEIEEGHAEGFEEITVRVGTGAGRRQRFVGVLLVEWSRSTSEREETYRVYRSRSGKYVLHLKRSSESVWTAGPDGQATGWRKHLASDQQWGTLPKDGVPRDLRRPGLAPSARAARAVHAGRSRGRAAGHRGP